MADRINDRNCFDLCVGKRVIGVLFNALPASDYLRAYGTSTLVFDDGSGLTVNRQGDFWIDDRNEVGKAIAAKEPWKFSLSLIHD